MYAQQLTAVSGPAGVQLVEIDEPDGTGLVVVDLHAAGVSFPDLLQTTGSYQLVRELPFVLGVEGAGIVRSAPAGSGIDAGQRVAVLATDGAWQQTVAVKPDSVFPLPDSVSLEAGAGFLMNYLTVHFALDERARYRAGETVLVHGAAGGVGVAALQVAAALGLETIAVVSTEEKAEIAKAHRATHVVLVDGWKDRVRDLTGGRGVDIILDPVGGDRFTDSLRSLAPNGRLVVLGFTGGEIPTVKVNRLLLRNISVLGAGWGEYVRTNPGYTARQWSTLGPLLESGALRIAEPTTYSFEHAGDALRTLETRSATGKIALSVRPS
ncbi:MULTISPECIES: NADPH:quinone oxidoreductase family protein [unclassified Rhodococcus (in: high G+C Gram-positive bacteria)]|uniref:NADPH:quinone oxidoreductase family protein n=1 Tax=unclassified Rhodococcus (in: high G+C Gram-positive bacteria) TaxID=192944 RepID=UPI00163B05B8|nr:MULTISPECIES: NADPH:quinone oxidoreductase family protein [unclassified Rhodococcus (in: high G+C Gram-positive bacteria)]MBC2641303.1 NADPH:quinone oxidoreductase family protein [Rhodococcus sp. 3A]MBC2893952.1 NADPH:quinone oxidoreductase family protein [Rhodococcus sp. 4CII]